MQAPFVSRMETAMRPLGFFSNFILNDLPELLEAAPEKLVGFWNSINLAIFCDLFSSKPPEWHDLALLDLKMLEAGIVHSGLVPPTTLIELIDQFTGDQIPGLNYEGLIFTNPSSDMRLFTRGEVSESERRFYSEHRAIEGFLECAIEKVRKAICVLLQDSGGTKSAVVALLGIEEDLKQVITKTASLRIMPREHFALFRKYLNSHPTRGLKGPSGAFTARIPILELLLRGDELPAEYFKYLENNMKYFPRDGRKAISDALQLISEGNTLMSLWRRNGEDPVLSAKVDAIGSFLNDFRAAHYRTVAHQIPEAIRGEIAGTGGESNPGSFLRERIKMTRFKKEGEE